MRRCPRCGTTTADWGTRTRNGRVCPAPYCRPCLRAYRRAHEAKRRRDPAIRERIRAQRRAVYERQRQDPVRLEKLRAASRERQRKRRREKADAVREANRRWWANVKADPIRHADFLVARRIEDPRRKDNPRGRKPTLEPYVPPTPPNSAGNGNSTAPLLNVAPLRTWLAFEFGTWGVGDVARRCGVNEATVRRILSGEQQRVSLHIADRMFVSADCPHLLAVLYPLPEAAA